MITKFLELIFTEGQEFSKENFLGFYLEKIKTVTPHKVKAIRQNSRLSRASRMTGLSAGFPIKENVHPNQIVHIVGSGASVLDFDFTSKEFSDSISISLNDAIFLPFYSDYNSFERGKGWFAEIKDPISYEEKINMALVETNADVLCRIPANPTTLFDYPEAILTRPLKAHLFTTIDALSEKFFDRQISYYLSDKVDKKSPGIEPGFSLGRIIMLLIKHGYRDIRLVGVDLFTSEHFWDVSNNHNWLLSTYGATEKKMHNTATKANFRQFTAPEFLEKLHKLEQQYDYQVRTDKRSGSAKILPSWN